eukprot:GHVR01045854.1.p2 GENE.GHVR01045854.1~~GHVR01045854.1.p2  ORF type:complete len:138 (-),score=11.85 GHVR01045854.1:285-698(-)
MAGHLYGLEVSSPCWKNDWDDAELRLNNIDDLHILWKGKPNYQRKIWFFERMQQWELNKLEFEKHKAEKQSRSRAGRHTGLRIHQAKAKNKKHTYVNSKFIDCDDSSSSSQEYTHKLTHEDIKSRKKRQMTDVSSQE